MRSFAVHQGLCTDIKIFIRYLTLQTEIQSCVQGVFYHLTNFSEIRKYKKNYDLSFSSLNHSLASESGSSPSCLIVIQSVTCIS